VEKPESVLEPAIRDRLCVLAHDLNNALSAISGHCEIMAQHAEPGSECEQRLHRVLAIVRKNAKRINGHECRMASAAQCPIEADNLHTPVKNSERRRLRRPQERPEFTDLTVGGGLRRTCRWLHDRASILARHLGVIRVKASYNTHQLQVLRPFALTLLTVLLNALFALKEHVQQCDVAASNGRSGSG
jgi:hypothetical protein